MKKETFYILISIAVAALLINIALNSPGANSTDYSNFSVTLAILALFALYFAPTLIAYSRGHKNKAGVFWVNLFLGITGIGWIGALIWAVQISGSGK